MEDRERSELIERLTAAGVYDRAAPGAAAQLDVLVHLAERGVAIDAMVGTEPGRLFALAADLAMFDFGTMMTPSEVAAACNTTVARVMRLRLASGLPAEAHTLLPSWAADDLAGFELGSAFFGDGPLLAFTRVMGGAAAKVAEAALGLFLNEVETALVNAGAAPVEHARANEQAADLVNVVTQLTNHLLREHLLLAVQRQRTGVWTGTESEMAVGFVDLASSTEWATSIPIRQQADALALFESAAWDIATQAGGRIVKLIGDEAMFVGPDPAGACRVAVELCAAVDAEPSLPRARGAVGFGPMVLRDGDYYGPLVHIVARAVKAAAEGAVVATDSVREWCGPERGLGFVDMGARELRGIEMPVTLYVVEVLA